MRKTDRRTMYTIEVIKETFMKLKRTRSFSEITVAELCREAEISRSTFYLHYNGTYEVLDAILDDIFSELKDPYSDETTTCKIPLCQMIRENHAYNSILMDDELSSRVIKKLIQKFEKSFLKSVGPSTTLTEEQLCSLFCFQINGCLAVSKRDLNLEQKSWCVIRNTIDQYINNGISGFSKRKEP